MYRLYYILYCVLYVDIDIYTCIIDLYLGICAAHSKWNLFASCHVYRVYMVSINYNKGLYRYLLLVIDFLCHFIIKMLRLH